MKKWLRKDIYDFNNLKTKFLNYVKIKSNNLTKKNSLSSNKRVRKPKFRKCKGTWSLFLSKTMIYQTSYKNSYRQTK